MRSLKKKNIEDIKWKKHPKCKKCRNGLKYEYAKYCCGSSGVREEYCEYCLELWQEDFLKLLEKVQERPQVWPPEKMLWVIKILRAKK